MTMTDEKKNKLTEKLKLVENEIEDGRAELHSISVRLGIAYAYETELEQRRVAAVKKTEELRIEYYQKMNSITKLYYKIKNIVDVFTGNWYGENL